MSKSTDFDWLNAKNKYLDSVGVEGGTCDGFVQFMAAYFLEHPNETPKISHLLLNVAASSWRKKITVKNFASGDLYLDGAACPGEISFRSQTSPGGYLTVKFGYCTILQFRLHCLELTTKANEVQNKAINEWKIYQEAVERANGNESLKMINF